MPLKAQALGVLALVLEVLVVDVAELLLGVAHAPCAVLAGRAVGGDGVAVFAALEAAHVAELLAVLQHVGVRLHHTPERAVQTVTGVVVGRWRQRGCHGVPVGAFGRARPWRVGGGVVVHAGASGRCLANLLR